MIRFLRFSARNFAIGYVALSIAVLALFAAPLWIEWKQRIEGSRTEFLREDAQRLGGIFDREGAAGLARAINAQVGARREGEKLLLLADPSFSRLAGNLPSWPAGIPTTPGAHVASITVEGEMMRVSTVGASLPGGYHLLVGRDVTRFRVMESYFWYGLLAASGTVLLLGVLSGWLVRRALLAEVQGISRTASAIVAGDLSRRLPVHGGAHELDTLAQTINRLLEQIEQLLHGVRNVSNAIAHDLRTPLAELRSRLEELSVTRPAPGETFAEIDSAVADVDRVIGIFNALLRLAEIDTGARRSGFVQVDVVKVAAEAAEFYQPLAELRGVKLSFQSAGALAVAGDPLLLAQAIGNLIDNALKFAPLNGTVTVATARRPGGAVEIAVSDNGPGIPDGEKSRVSQRFYRGDASRGTPGVGLGLSLVEGVARLHGGTLELIDNEPGLQATLVVSSLMASSLAVSSLAVPSATSDVTARPVS
jgi:signal transduction histidine kinase